MTKEEKNTLLDNLVHLRNRPKITGFMTYYLDDEPLSSPPLSQLLSLEDSWFTDTARQVLQYLENTDKGENAFFDYEKFKRKVHAFISLQDMLYTPYFDGTSWATLFQIRYFYYESKFILTESVLGSFNGLYIGNNYLLRLFLEFNLIQLYYFNTAKKDRSFKRFTEYLSTKVTPGNTALIAEAIPNDQFCKPIKKRIQWELKHLSNRYSHPYFVDDSPKAGGIHTPGTSLDTLAFFVQTSAVLDAVLWMYYVNLPMLFVRLDVFKRFGFDIPPGFFATPSTHTIVKQSLPAHDYEIFKQYAESQDTVRQNLKWYQSMPDLSEEEIWNTASDPRNGDETITEYYIRRTLKMRLQAEQIAQIVRSHIEKEEKGEDYIDEALEAYTNFAKFREVYTRLK